MTEEVKSIEEQQKVMLEEIRQIIKKYGYKEITSIELLGFFHSKGYNTKFEF